MNFVNEMKVWLNEISCNKTSKFFFWFKCFCSKKKYKKIPLRLTKAQITIKYQVRLQFKLIIIETVGNWNTWTILRPSMHVDCWIAVDAVFVFVSLDLNNQCGLIENVDAHSLTFIQLDWIIYVIFFSFSFPSERIKLIRKLICWSDKHTQTHSHVNFFTWYIQTGTRANCLSELFFFIFELVHGSNTRLAV